jgi:hypothetical protein
MHNIDYLTFRNSPNLDNTGRTVFSQQFDYRSLEKYPQDDHTDQPRYNFRKNVKNIRSQDKYKQLREEAAFSQMTD